MPPIFTYRNDDDSAQLGAFATFSVVTGTSTTPQTIHIWNDFAGAGADPATGLILSVASRSVGDPDPPTQEHAFARYRMMQIRSTGVVGSGAADEDTGLVAVGKGAEMAIGDIPAGSGRVLILQPTGDPGVGNMNVEVFFLLRSNGVAVTLESGHFETGGQGICTGIGDSSFAQILDGGVCTPTGTPDDKVAVADIRGVCGGVPVCVLDHQETFTAVDVNTVTLGVGETYPCTLTLSATGVQQRKGAIGDTEFPPTPAGERLIAQITVPYGLVIDTPQIDQTLLLYGFYSVTFSGTNAIVSPGHSIVGNSYNRPSSNQTIALTLTADNTLWIMPSGALEKTTDGTKPSPKALAFWFATTDGSSVTANHELRTWTGPRSIPITLTVDNTGGLSATTNGLLQMFAGNSPAYIFVSDDSVMMAVDDSGGTSGSTIGKLQYFPPGGSWTTLYTNSGSKDRRPTVPFGTAAPASVSGAKLEVRKIPAKSFLRGVVDAVPGSSVPKRVVFNLTLWVP